MADTIPSIAFSNQLAYDLIVYDSFDNDDDDGSGPDTGTNGKPSNQAYYATLTQLGKVPAGATVSLQPIHDSSIFVAETASDSKPVKRMVAYSYDEITALSIVKDDETAMTQTFRFVNLLLNSPTDPVSIDFNKVINTTSDDHADDIDNFFAGQPDYSNCCFEDYMMALAYTALHPQVPDPAQPPGTSSLKTVSTLMGSKWPAGLSDIFVTKFTCATKDKHLILTFEVDISTLPFESAQITSNVLTLLSGTKVVKAQIMFNYAIGLNIFGTRLSLLLDALTIPIGNNKTQSVKKPGISIDINPLFKFVVFTVKATFPFNINGNNFDAIASFVVDNEEVAIGVDIQGDHSSLPAPPGVKGLHFDEFGVGMGLFFTPPAFALGLQGKFHIGEPNGGNIVDLNDDTFALVCEFIEEAIKPKYVAFYVPKLSINEVIELFTDANPNISVPINFTDLSFHWSDGLMDVVVLPDGTLSNGGYGFSAAVSIYWLNLYGNVELDLNNGFSALVEMSPLTIGKVFKLTGDGKGVTIKVDQNGNPIRNNQVQNTKELQDALKTATDKQLVSPGGPVLEINTFKSPLLHMNAKASLFDLIDYDITADIELNTILFSLDFRSILDMTMSCSLHAGHSFYAIIHFGIDKTISLPDRGVAHLGSIRVQAQAGGNLWIDSSASDVVIGVAFGFDFMGSHVNTGRFTLDVPVQKIEDLMGCIYNKIEQSIEQLFGYLYHDAETWAGYVKTGAISIYDTVSNVLINFYDKSLTEVTLIMKGAGYEAQEITADMKAAKYEADLIVSELKNTIHVGVDGVQSAMKWAGYEVPEVIGALQKAFDVTEISSALKNVYGLGVNEVNSFLQSAGYTADQVEGAFESLGGEFEDFANEAKDKITNPDTWNPSKW